MGRPQRESNSITKTLADRLSDLMEKEKLRSGLKQEEICKRIGVASSSYSDWASDQKTPNVDKVALIANYFDVSVDWLLGLPGGTKSRDPNMKNAMLYTGLSEDALLWIKNMACDPHKESLQVLDRMLATDEFQYIISYIVYITKIFDEIKHGTLWHTLNAEERSVITAARKIFFEKDMYDIYSVELPEKAASAKQVLQSIFVEMVENLFFAEKEWGKYPLTTPVGTDSTLTK